MLGSPLHQLDVCDSTNDELARLASAGASHGTVLVSRHQRRGRGRQGRAWQSGGEQGLNLFGSILLRPSLTPSEVPPLTLVVGLAVLEAIDATGVRAGLKWPNDIVVGRCKLGGILAEASSQGGTLEHVIVGVGINIATVPTALEPIATSLVREGAALVDPCQLMRAIAAALEPKIASFEQAGLAGHRDAFLERWRDRGRPARAVSGDDVIAGTAHDVSASGALVIKEDNGRLVPVVAGEVEIDYV